MSSNWSFDQTANGTWSDYCCDTMRTRECRQFNRTYLGYAAPFCCSTQKSNRPSSHIWLAASYDSRLRENWSCTFLSRARAYKSYVYINEIERPRMCILAMRMLCTVARSRSMKSHFIFIDIISICDVRHSTHECIYSVESEIDSIANE